MKRMRIFRSCGWKLYCTALSWIERHEETVFGRSSYRPFWGIRAEPCGNRNTLIVDVDPDRSPDSPHPDPCSVREWIILDWRNRPIDLLKNSVELGLSKESTIHIKERKIRISLLQNKYIGGA